LRTEVLIAHGQGHLAAARAKLEDGLAAAPAPLLPRYTWPLLWLGMRIEADDATCSRDRREALPDISSERCRDLVRLSGELAALTPPARGYRALFTAEHARVSGTDDSETWAAAVHAWRVAGEPYPLAYALLRLAEAHCGTGDRQAAADAVREASATASRIGAIPLAGEAAALARRARLSLDDPPGDDTGQADHASATPPDEADELARFGLTGREREVLMLLAIGRSNSQIGQETVHQPQDRQRARFQHPRQARRNGPDRSRSGRPPAWRGQPAVSVRDAALGHTRQALRIRQNRKPGRSRKSKAPQVPG